MFISHASMMRLLRKGLYNGLTQHTDVRYSWDISGDCMSPVVRELHSNPKNSNRFCWTKGDSQPFQVALTVRCRKCAACLKRRRAVWTYRAKCEMTFSQRSWFGTITFRAEEHYRMRCEARAYLKTRGVNFEELTVDEKWMELQRIAANRITLWIKRVRKASKAKLRYILVAEQHKSGLPHYHIIVNECVGTVRHRDLADNWHDGFTNFKLVVGTRPLSYVAKYLGKSNDARVRASLHYGKSAVRPLALGKAQPKGEFAVTPKKLTQNERVWVLIESLTNELSSELQNGPQCGKSETSFQRSNDADPHATPANTCQRQQPETGQRQQAIQEWLQSAFPEFVVSDQGGGRLVVARKS